MEKELQTVKDNSPTTLIEKAIAGGANLEQLEKVLLMQERWEKNQAKKAFNAAMVEVHKNIPVIVKSLDNNQTHSKYASLDIIVSKTKAIYTAEGFSISFYEGETSKENHIRICADVTHCLGHKEQYHYDVPLDGKGIKGNTNMTSIHAKASSTSYARRYLMCMVWNIPTGDDTDGNMTDGNMPEEKITAEQVKELADELHVVNIDLNKFYAYFKINDIQELPKTRFKAAKIAIEQVKKRKMNGG